MNYKTLTFLQKIIKVNQKVCFLAGKPGIGKSSIIKKVAKNLGLKLIDIRLSMVDESEIIGIPSISSDGKSFTYAKPEWVVEAQKQPSLIFFDELNRAKPEVIDACLQILLDKKIGMTTFNQDVYFASAGNLGEADGTNVQEIENAALDRLAVIKYDLSLNQWIDQFAEENVLPTIVDFLKNHPSEFYKLPDEDSSMENYPTPRSWTQLSDTIKDFSIEEQIEFCKEVGTGYVGKSIIQFISYLESKNQIKIDDILKADTNAELNEIKKIVVEDKDIQIELSNEYDKVDIDNLTKKQVKNLSELLNCFYDDLKITILRNITDKVLLINDPKESNWYTIIKDNEEEVKRYLESNS